MPAPRPIAEGSLYRAPMPHNPDPRVSLTGDAHLILLSPLDLRRELIDREDQETTFLVDPHALQHWLPSSSSEVLRTLRGSLTYVDDQQDEVADVLSARPQVLTRLRNALLLGLPPGVDTTCFRLLACEALIFTLGEVALRLRIVVDKGWDSGDVLAAFGVETRDATCDAVRAATLPLVRELRAACTTCPPDHPLDLPYFHLMYAGTARTSPLASGQDDVLRALLYPPDSGPLLDHSPRRNEFVFLGYAFSLVAGEADVEERVREISIVVALCSSVFRRFERVCDAVARVLSDTGSTCDRPELLRLQETVQVEYEDLLSPTLSYRHELLVLREGLLQQWQADRLAVRSRTLLGLLHARLSRLDVEQGSRTARKLELLLLAVAAMSLFSVATDAVSLAGSGAWVVLAVVSCAFFAVLAYALRALRS